MHTKRFLSILATLALMGCGRDSADEVMQEEPPYVPISVEIQADTQKANLKFAMNILQALDEPDQNLCFSPLSMSIALGMVLNGASGDTYNAIARTLGYEKATLDTLNKENQQLKRILAVRTSRLTIHTANGVWVLENYPLNPDFVNALQTFYEASVETAPLTSPAAADRINRWVDEQTQGMIDRLFDPTDFDEWTRVVLVNALYFEGKWHYPFPKRDTRDAPFYLENGDTKQVPMMRLWERLPYFKGEGFEAVVLPYSAEDFAFYLFLPEKGRTVAQLRELFTPENWAKWATAFNTIEGVLEMPRFKIETTYDLKPPLSALGMGIAFDFGKADFSRMVVAKSEEFFIRKAIQKTVVEVDEEGTKAAVVTGMEVAAASLAPAERFSMRVDRPFMFAIVHQPTNTILFLGIVREP